MSSSEGAAEPKRIWGTEALSLPGRRRSALAITAASEGWGRTGVDEMVHELDRFWYVAAVFRDPRDLATTAEELRSNSLAAGQLMVLANHRADGADKVLDNSGRGPVWILSHRTVGSTGSDCGRGKVSQGLTALLDAFDGGPPAAAHAPASSRDNGDIGRRSTRNCARTWRMGRWC